MDQTTPKIGTILSENDNQRDAIHLAVAPIIAAYQLYRGERVGLDEQGNASPLADPKIGIVDPFLPDLDIQKGERFYLFLYPGTITSLRHVWIHPAFTALNQTQRKEITDVH